MKKQIAAFILAGALCGSAMPVQAASLDPGSLAEQADELVQQAGGLVNGLGEKIDLSSLSLDSLNLDSVISAIRNNEVLQSLNLGSLDPSGLLGLLDNSDLLGTFGISQIDKPGLEESLRDETVSKGIQDILGEITNGESVTDTVKSLLDNVDIQDMFSRVTGVSLDSVLEKLNKENVLNLIKEGVKALLGGATQTGADMPELSSVLQQGLNALFG